MKQNSHLPLQGLNQPSEMIHLQSLLHYPSHAPATLAHVYADPQSEVVVQVPR